MRSLPASGTWDARHPATAAAGALVPVVAGLISGTGLITSVVLALVLAALVGAVGAAKLPPWRDVRFPPAAGAGLIVLAGVAGGVVAGLTAR